MTVYLESALVCERVEFHEDGMVSIHKPIDRIDVTLTDGDPAEEPQVELRFTIVVGFKSDQLGGHHEMSISGLSPRGTRVEFGVTPIELAPDSRSHRTIAETNFTTAGAGVYWFDISVDGQLLTRMPLEVRYLAEGT